MHVLAGALGIVGFVGIFVKQVVVSFHPLYEFQVVLVLGLGEFFDVDVLLDAAFVEALLQDLVVIDELPLVLGAPVDALHGHLAREHGIDDLTVDGPCAQLLDAGDLQLQ